VQGWRRRHKRLPSLLAQARRQRTLTLEAEALAPRLVVAVGGACHQRSVRIARCDRRVIHRAVAMRENAIVAKVDRTFSMQMPPEKARALFIEDIAPEFHRVDDFVLCKEDPGRLEFSDADVDPMANAGNDWREYAMLRRATARRIRVEFESEGIGCRVVIRGHAERDLQKAIALLGEPGHWPEGRSQRP
jgi:hypothetical protein